MAALLLSSCAGGDPPRAEPTGTGTPTAREARETQTVGASAAVAGAVEGHLARYGSRLEGTCAVVVVYRGKTVYEWYDGTTAGEFHDVRSVTKSVMSTLIGVAIADGDVSGTRATLGELLPDYRRTMTLATARTTLGQLLSMTAGFPNSWDGQAGDGWVFAKDPVAAILGTQDRRPGRQFAYSDTSAHLLGAILERATGEPLLQYARTKLFDPLGIDTRPASQPVLTRSYDIAPASSQFAWPVDAAGLNLGPALMKLRPRDMAKLGLLFLHHGRWHGRQLVPAAWVAAATSRHADAVGLGGADVAYGYMWWVGQAQDDPAFLAWGFGGQAVRVIPRRDLVIVVSTNLPQPDSEGAGVESVLNLTDNVIAPLLPPSG